MAGQSRIGFPSMTLVAAAALFLQCDSAPDRDRHISLLAREFLLLFIGGAAPEPMENQVDARILQSEGLTESHFRNIYEKYLGIEGPKIYLGIEGPRIYR